MKFKRGFLGAHVLNNDTELLDELHLLARHNVHIKKVLDCYKNELDYSNTQILENLSEILMTITKALLDRNNTLERELINISLKSTRIELF